MCQRGGEIRGGEFQLEILGKQEDIELRRQFKIEVVNVYGFDGKLPSACPISGN
jgi:hypothetical protein